jgi:Transcriptional regulator containing PAS, AAA-type ATPase, and DNA-binding domains
MCNLGEGILCHSYTFTAILPVIEPNPPKMMNSAPYVSLLLASTLSNTACDEIEKSLTKAGILAEGRHDNSQPIGLILLVSVEADADWLDEKLSLAKALNKPCMVIWAGKTCVERKDTWRWLLGGADFVVHWRNDEASTNSVLSRIQRWQKIEEALSSAWVKEHLAGDSPVWRSALRQLAEIAIYSKAPILILGESGTGKEMSAQFVHQLSAKAENTKLTLLDCSSIVPELSGSEFFGHEKGAFTNAVYARDGVFALANNGTLFLDEIGELPIHLQAELLRVAQDGLFKRVGSNQWQRTSFRLISATNRDLSVCVQNQTFRADLYYRISTWVCQLPSLKERVEDIPLLAETFVRQLLPNHVQKPYIEPWLLTYLCAKEYAGNVRELKQLVSRLVSRYVGNGVLSLADLPQCDRNAQKSLPEVMQHAQFLHFVRSAVNEGQGLKQMVADFSELTKRIALEETAGNIQAASELLQVSDRTMQLFLSGKTNHF